VIGLTILGSTGSIGLSTLDVISRHPESYRVVALTANKRVTALFEQCQKYQPEYAVMADDTSASQLRESLQSVGSKTQVLSGIEGLQKVAELDQVDAVMAAIVGAAGLRPTLSAAQAGKRLLLANKEALVVAGKLFMDAVREGGAELLPIDSEHNAVFQCLPKDYRSGLKSVGVEKILLTASGGPFRTLPMGQLERVTPAQACAHPNWEMGQKISVDSATMMNKGLEVIEACWLFGAKAEDIQVVIHPQSIIHSMVSYSDGSVLAQLGNPDMRTPIAHALAWPERIQSGVSPLDLFTTDSLQFEAPDLDRFPCLQLAYDAINAGGTAPAILNAANEVAVQAFLDGRLGFSRIAPLISEVLNRLPAVVSEGLDALMETDAEARTVAEQWLRTEV